MKLYGVPAAPNPTKVMLYLAEREARGAQMDIEQVRVNTLKGEQNLPEHLARNVFGALPTLELDDGRFIVESLAIIYFLEDLFPEGALQSVEPVATKSTPRWSAALLSPQPDSAKASGRTEIDTI